MTNVLALETKRYPIRIENFEGPLDLLCTLIEKNKMSIYDINLNEITDQYIEYLKKMEEMNLEVASEFLVMASELLYLKSRKLLPSKQEDEEELTEDELIRRIIEYKKYKDITAKLRNNFNIYSERFYNLPEKIELQKQELKQDYVENLISTIYEQIIERNNEKENKNAKNIEKIAITETFTIASKVKEMFRELIKHNRFVFNKLFSINQHSKQEVVTAFSGLLELSRRNKVITSQEEMFGDITVKKRK